MSGLGVIISGVVAFTLIVLALVAVILLAKSTLVPSGNVTIEINENTKVSVPTGGKLLGTLADQGIYIPSACGGGGSCGQCKVRVLSGGGEILPTEVGQMTRKEVKEHMRLACQTPVKQDMKIEVAPEILSVKKWTCKVRSNISVGAFTKELILDLPEGESVDFKAGGYIQIERPGGLTIRYKDYDVPEIYRPEWGKYWDLVSYSAEPVTRAYSMANYPQEKGIVKLDVRLAVPPKNKPDADPGLMSSFIFSLKPGDEVVISGPYGEFFIRDNDREKVYIGGGVGMAPLRSHIFEMLKHLDRKEKISFWYGAKNCNETFYIEEFEELAKTHPNFSFHLSIYHPKPEDGWTGDTAYIPQVLRESFLKKHKAPEDCEYFMCGPGSMTKSTLEALDEFGVERTSIFFDDFGS